MRKLAAAIALLLVTTALGALLGAPPAAAQDDEDQDPASLFTVFCKQIRCVFDASNATLADGEIESYEWDFGDGSTGTGEAANHVYENAGAYNVTLTVESEDGQTAQETREISVSVERDTLGDSLPWIALVTGLLVFLVAMALARLV